MRFVRNLDLWSNQFWGPWSQFGRFREDLDTLLFNGVVSHEETPALNVWTSDEGTVVTMDLPGIDLKSLDIDVEGETLTLRGSRKQEELAEGERLIRCERGSGDFTRTVTLPFRVDSDAVVASYARGVLEIRLPRAESERPRKIEVQPS